MIDHRFPSKSLADGSQFQVVSDGQYDDLATEALLQAHYLAHKVEIDALSGDSLSEAEVQFKKIQQRLDYNEFLRTGRAVDPRGAVSVARAWAAVCMLLNRWHYPTKADLDTDVNKAILQKIYADPTANTNEKSSTAQKQAVLHYTLVMLEGQAFGIDYQAELGAYERTASGAFREKVKSDPRDWLLLPVHKWETCLAMFLEVMG